MKTRWPRGYIPPIKSVMTPFPYSIAPDETLVRAAEQMAKHEIRHLPVEQEGEIVGIVTERDLRTLGVVAATRTGPQGTLGSDRPIREVMTTPAFVVDLETPLDIVLGEIVRRVVGCAVVSKEGRLAGVFTVVDACRLFAEQLGHEPPGEGSAA